jgi:hypothetical protein
MKTPDVIYLIDMGDEISWCDDPNPSGNYEPDDSIAYVKKEQRDQLLEALEDLMEIAKESRGIAGYHLNGVTAEWDEFEFYDKARAAIAAAKGEA